MALHRIRHQISDWRIRPPFNAPGLVPRVPRQGKRMKAPTKWDGIEVLYAFRSSSGVKVGYSRKLSNRYSSIKADLGGIQLVAVAPGGYQDEQALHDALSSHRVNGDVYPNELYEADAEAKIRALLNSRPPFTAELPEYKPEPEPEPEPVPVHRNVDMSPTAKLLDTILAHDLGLRLEDYVTQLRRSGASWGQVTERVQAHTKQTFHADLLRTTFPDVQRGTVLEVRHSYLTPKHLSRKQTP